MSIVTPPRTSRPAGGAAAAGGNAVPPTGAPPFGSPPSSSPPGPRRRFGVWRLLLGCLIVLLCAAGATAVAIVDEVHTLADALSQNKALNVGSGALASAGWGAPETLLLVGNDQRNHTTTTPVLPHSNEMLLVRFDPGKPYISMMSIPRELEVPIQTSGGVVTTRLNAALFYGGIGLLVETIKQVTGLTVNHVAVIDFNNFVRAVNEMGCVYSTVDRRYYHINTPTSQQYFEVNLQPGYQKMCGTQALQFVSYRHGDTSLVRDARDQDFLLDVKKQYGPTLVDNLHRFEQIFGQTVQTDSGLHSYDGLVNLIGTLISSESLRVRQVQFQANLLPTFDTATPQQIAASVHAFLFGGSSVPKRSTAQTARALNSKKAIARLPLAPVPASELSQAHQLAMNVPFEFEYPRVQDAAGAGVPVFLRNYLIHAPGGVAYPAYVAVFDTGQLGQYYDVQGMTWTTAPLFDSPDQSVTVAGRSYYLFYSGQHLQTVAWYEHGAAYWVHNTLTDAIGNGEMLAIAEQTAPITVSAAAGRQARLSLRAAGVPLRPPTTSKIDARQMFGSLAGLLALVGLALLGFLGIKRIRDLGRLRKQLAAGHQVGARLPGGGAVPAYAGAPAGYAPQGRTVPPGARPYTPPAPSMPAAPTRPPTYGPTTTYRSSRLRRPLKVLVVIVVLAVGAGLAVALIAAGRHVQGATRSAAQASARARAEAKLARAPSVPVVVLNATSTQGAAHRLALQLGAERVTVSEVGNVTETRPPGLEVLYALGERAQAEKLARLLSSRSPTVAPIDPVTAAAAGNGAELVVVIT